MCLALTKLLETNQPFILLNLQSLMSLWTDVVTELREDAADTGGDSLVYGAEVENDATATALEQPEDTRRRQLTAADDVHKINVTEYIKYHLQQAIEACGGNDQFQEHWLANVDKDVVKGFSELGIL